MQSRFIFVCRVLEEMTIPKKQWSELGDKKPKSLFVLEETSGPKNVKIRALGTLSLVPTNV